jgi:hypothetical protein
MSPQIEVWTHALKPNSTYQTSKVLILRLMRSSEAEMRGSLYDALSR